MGESMKPWGNIEITCSCCGKAMTSARGSRWTSTVAFECSGCETYRLVVRPSRELQPMVGLFAPHYVANK